MFLYRIVAAQAKNKILKYKSLCTTSFSSADVSVRFKLIFELSFGSFNSFSLALAAIL